MPDPAWQWHARAELPELPAEPDPNPANLDAAPDVAERFGAGGWRFTREVAAEFDGHVRASVPFYDDIQAMIAQCCDWLAPAGGLIADFGASTGNTALAILDRHKDRDLRFVLYDEQASMLARARPAVEALAPGRVDARALRLQDGQMFHHDADLTIAAFVLQFMTGQDRRKVLTDARHRSKPTGAILVAEKIRPCDTRWAEIGTNVSHDYKASQGISDQAIRAKERALRGVLNPYTLPGTLSLLAEAGWQAREVLFRWHQWVLIGAFAGE